MTDTLVPNFADADVGGMAGLDAGHLQSLNAAHAGYGVVSGCAVTDTTGLGLTVAAGVIVGPSGSVAVAGGTVTLTTGAGVVSGSARRDLVVANTTTGAVSVTTGIAAATQTATWPITLPPLPTLETDEVLLATYWMGTGETASDAARIVAARSPVPAPVPELVADDPTEVDLTTAGGTTTLTIEDTIARRAKNARYENGTTYTPVADDAAALLLMNNASAITVTLPEGVFATGESLTFLQFGVGQVSFVAGTSTTVLSESGYDDETRDQYSVVQAILIDDDFLSTGNDVWLLVGALDPT